MELSALPRAVRDHWVAAVVAFAVVAVVTLLAALVPQQRYSATAVVSVQPATEEVSTQLLSYLIPSLQARVEGESLRADVAASLPEDLADEDWGVVTDVPPGSGVVSITVESGDDQLPVVAANAYAQVLDGEDLGTDALDVVLIDPASEPESGSARAAVLLSGLALAVLVAGLVALLRSQWGRRGSTRGAPARETDAARAPARGGSGRHEPQPTG